MTRSTLIAFIFVFGLVCVAAESPAEDYLHSCAVALMKLTVKASHDSGGVLQNPYNLELSWIQYNITTSRCVRNYYKVKLANLKNGEKQESHLLMVKGMNDTLNGDDETFIQQAQLFVNLFPGAHYAIEVEEIKMTGNIDVISANTEFTTRPYSPQKVDLSVNEENNLKIKFHDEINYDPRIDYLAHVSCIDDPEWFSKVTSNVFANSTYGKENQLANRILPKPGACRYFMDAAWSRLKTGSFDIQSDPFTGEAVTYSHPLAVNDFNITALEDTAIYQGTYRFKIAWRDDNNCPGAVDYQIVFTSSESSSAPLSIDLSSSGDMFSVELEPAAMYQYKLKVLAGDQHMEASTESKTFKTFPISPVLIKGDISTENHIQVRLIDLVNPIATMLYQFYVNGQVSETKSFDNAEHGIDTLVNLPKREDHTGACQYAIYVVASKSTDMSSKASSQPIFVDTPPHQIDSIDKILILPSQQFRVSFKDSKNCAPDGNKNPNLHYLVDVTTAGSSTSELRDEKPIETNETAVTIFAKSNPNAYFAATFVAHVTPILTLSSGLQVAAPTVSGGYLMVAPHAPEKIVLSLDSSGEAFLVTIADSFNWRWANLSYIVTLFKYGNVHSTYSIKSNTEYISTVLEITGLNTSEGSNIYTAKVKALVENGADSAEIESMAVVTKPNKLKSGNISSLVEYNIGTETYDIAVHWQDDENAATLSNIFYRKFYAIIMVGLFSNMKEFSQETNDPLFAVKIDLKSYSPGETIKFIIKVVAEDTSTGFQISSDPVNHFVTIPPTSSHIEAWLSREDEQCYEFSIIDTRNAPFSIDSETLEMRHLDYICSANSTANDFSLQNETFARDLVIHMSRDLFPPGGCYYEIFLSATLPGYFSELKKLSLVLATNPEPPEILSTTLDQTLQQNSVSELTVTFQDLLNCAEALPKNSIQYAISIMQLDSEGGNLHAVNIPTQVEPSTQMIAKVAVKNFVSPGCSFKISLETALKDPPTGIFKSSDSNIIDEVFETDLPTPTIGLVSLNEAEATIMLATDAVVSCFTDIVPSFKLRITSNEFYDETISSTMNGHKFFEAFVNVTLGPGLNTITAETNFGTKTSKPAELVVIRNSTYHNPSCYGEECAEERNALEIFLIYALPTCCILLLLAIPITIIWYRRKIAALSVAAKPEKKDTRFKGEYATIAEIMQSVKEARESGPENADPYLDAYIHEQKTEFVVADRPGANEDMI